MKIDLHVHTAERSRCGKSSEDDQIRAAVAAGLDAIVLTDHRRFAPPATIARWNRDFWPFKVFNGIEITASEHDFLVLGVYDPTLEEREFDYPELHAWVRNHGGFMALAHPFRSRDEIPLDLDRYPVDAIEVYSRNTPPHAAQRIFDVAERLGIPTLSNSDAHSCKALGLFYNLLESDPGDEAALIEQLRLGNFNGMTCCPDGSIRQTSRRDDPCPRSITIGSTV